MRNILISKQGEFEYSESNFSRKLAVIMVARLVKHRSDKGEKEDTVSLKRTLKPGG